MVLFPLFVLGSAATGGYAPSTSEVIHTRSGDPVLIEFCPEEDFVEFLPGSVIYKFKDPGTGATTVLENLAQLHVFQWL